MFKLVRTAILVLAAFVAGVLYERGHQKDVCESVDGVWIGTGFCGVPK